MIVRSNVKVNLADMEAAEKFAKSTFWNGECKDILHSEFVLDLPYAPPGMYQHIGVNEMKYHCDWLNHTVFDWQWENIRALGTNQENIFWVFRDGKGKVKWGGIKGEYKSKFATMLKIINGKILYAKDFFDPIEFYHAMEVELPIFVYDAKNVNEFKEREHVTDIKHTEESWQKQVNNTLNFFIKPDYWNPEVNNVLANDFIHELTFAPAEMPRIFKGREYDALNEWLDRHLLGGTIYDEVFYETTDPHIFITEYNCLFETNWGYSQKSLESGAHGRYPNREISYIEIDDNGRCKRLDEYLNSMSKFLSINAMIPTFPYMYY